LVAHGNCDGSLSRDGDPEPVTPRVQKETDPCAFMLKNELD